MDNIKEIIIQLIEDHGYNGSDLLNLLTEIYNEYQAKHIKQFVINNYEYFVYLKDTIWMNFEHLPNFPSIKEAKGLKTLCWFGSRFPNLVHLFDGEVNIVPNFYLSILLTEIEQVIKLWNEKPIIYMTNIYIREEDSIDLHGGINPTEIIIYEKGENPLKYSKKIVSAVLKDKNGKSLTNDKQYGYAQILGTINKEEQHGKILFNILVDLKDAITNAIQWKKDLSLVVNY